MVLDSYAKLPDLLVSSAKLAFFVLFIVIRSDARVGGMLAGKPGLLHLHMGAGGPTSSGGGAGGGGGGAGGGNSSAGSSRQPERLPFQTLVDAVEGSDVPVRNSLSS